MHRNTQLISGSLPICPNRNFEIISAEMDQKGKELERLIFQSSSKIFPPRDELSPTRQVLWSALPFSLFKETGKSKK